MADFDINAGLANIGTSLIDDLIIRFSPDEAISAIDALVHVAVDKDMSGEEKAEWVLAQALDLVEDVWEWVLPRLIELLYKVMMGYIKDFRIGK